MKRPWLFLFLPVALHVAGSLSNSLVCIVNHGFMPVHVPGGCELLHFNWNHVCMSAATHLNFLGDWMTTNSGVMSPGDWLLDMAAVTKIPSMLAWLGLLLEKHV